MHYYFTFGEILALILFGGFWFCATRSNLKFLEQGPDKLTLRIYPMIAWGGGGLLLGIGVLLVLTFLTSVSVTIFTCNRSSVQLPLTATERNPASIACNLVEINRLRVEKSKVYISGLQGAKIATKHIEENRGINIYRSYAVLLTNKGNVPFNDSINLIGTTDDYNPTTDPKYEKIQALSSQINTFVSNPLRDSLIAKQDAELGYIILSISGFFTLIGLLILIIAPLETCTFNKSLNSMTLQRHNAFTKQVFRCLLSDISEIKVDENKIKGASAYLINFILISGESLHLPNYYTPGYKEKQQVVNCIQRFLVSSCFILGRRR